MRPLADVPGEAGVSLNAEQRAAIDARGLVFVSAGAGTGKTFTLVQVVTHLVAVRRLPPPRILMLTFSEKAAAELACAIQLLLQHFDSAPSGT